MLPIGSVGIAICGAPKNSVYQMPGSWRINRTPKAFVDRNGHSAGGPHAVHRQRGLNRFIEEDRHAIARLEALLEQSVRQGHSCRRETVIGRGAIAVDNCRLVRRALGAREQRVFNALESWMGLENHVALLCAYTDLQPGRRKAP